MICTFFVIFMGSLANRYTGEVLVIAGFSPLTLPLVTASLSLGQQATTGQAPIEVIVPEARRMPLYRLINDPFRALQERGHVKLKANLGLQA